MALNDLFGRIVEWSFRPIRGQNFVGMILVRLKKIRGMVELKFDGSKRFGEVGRNKGSVEVD